MTPDQLIHRTLLGEAPREEVAELDRLLANDPALRRKWVIEAGTDAGLREIALERMSEASGDPTKFVKPAVRPVAWLATAAALVFLAALVWMQVSKPKVIATLVSVEDASWESSLPTSPGSKLTAGYLKLTAGIATVRFQSGAEVTLEAPSNLVLETEMRGRLLEGAAVIDVPESAIGFVIETPDGFAVDHGTRFSVSVNEADQKSDFEVLEGEISVHHPKTGTKVRLVGKEATTASGSGLEKIDGPLPETAMKQTGGVIRVGTHGSERSVIRNNDQDYLHPDFLMVKTSKGRLDFDRRAFFSFDLDGTVLDNTSSARLRLNLVPTGIGFASHLPKTNRFSVYGFAGGISAESREWELAPDPEKGSLLGDFEIPRSQQRGVFGISSDALFHFLKTHAGSRVTFLLVRDTSEQESRGLVHCFASDSHPEASGPLLELFPKEENPTSK